MRTVIFGKRILTSMKQIHSLLLFLTGALIILSGCQNDVAKKLLTGTWRGVEWQVDGKATQRDVQSVVFIFEENGTYAATFGTQQEAGTYRLEGDKLYTNAEGQVQKMVKLPRLTADTLVMDMNRAGTAETLVLARGE
jgi:lipocalin-like protein